MEDTKQRILEKSLELFSTKGYDAVSVGEIAKAVGIKAPSLYNHFPSKQAIFDAILETTSAHYQKDTAEISVHVQDSQKDIPVFSHISEELLQYVAILNSGGGLPDAWPEFDASPDLDPEQEQED